MDMSPIHQVRPNPSSKAQWKGEESQVARKEMGRHQGIDRPGVCQVPEGSGEQTKMEETGCEVICGAPMIGEGDVNLLCAEFGNLLYMVGAGMILCYALCFLCVYLIQTKRTPRFCFSFLQLPRFCFSFAFIKFLVLCMGLLQTPFCFKCCHFFVWFEQGSLRLINSFVCIWFTSRWLNGQKLTIWVKRTQRPQ